RAPGLRCDRSGTFSRQVPFKSCDDQVLSKTTALQRDYITATNCGRVMTTLQSYLALHACGWYNVFLLRLTWVNHSLSARRPSTSMAAAGKPGERRYLCVSNHRNEYEVVVILDPSTPEEEQANL